MAWLSWRLQRTELLLLACVLLVLGVSLLFTRADLVTDTRTNLFGGSCPAAIENHNGRQIVCDPSLGWLYKTVRVWLPWFAALPLLAALLLALPIVREIERSTHRLVWTQGVTRARWLRTRFALAAIGGLIFAALSSLAFEWWHAPADFWPMKLAADSYNLRDALPFGHALFAIGLMLAVGVVLRRLILTFAVTAGMYVTVLSQTSVWVRPRLVPPETSRSTFAEPPVSEPIALPLSEPVVISVPDSVVDIVEEGELDYALIEPAWVLFNHFVDPAGNIYSEDEIRELCAGVEPHTIQQTVCYAERGLTFVSTFHPESHYWPLQLVETGLYLGVGAALMGFAAWWVVRRVE